MTLSRVPCLGMAALATFIWFTASAEATDKTWAGSDGGLFISSANWSPSGAPGSSDAAIFANGSVGSSYDINFGSLNPFPPPTYLPGNYTVDRLIVATNPLNFTGSTSSTLTIDSTNTGEIT